MRVDKTDVPTDFQPLYEIAIYKAAGFGKEFYHALAAKLHPRAEGVVRGPWRDLSESDVVALRGAFATMGGAASWGVLPERVLAVKPGGCCWWTEAARRPLYLSDSLAEKTGLPVDAECHWPALLFVADMGRMLCFALPESRRPAPDTPLLLPPLWNINDTGGVCLGSARLTRRAQDGADAFVRDAEDAFFLSQFSHIYGNKARLDRMEIQEAWHAAREGGFPVEAILPANMSLAHLLEDRNF